MNDEEYAAIAEAMDRLMGERGLPVCFFTGNACEGVCEHYCAAEDGDDEPRPTPFDGEEA